VSPRRASALRRQHRRDDRRLTRDELKQLPDAPEADGPRSAAPIMLLAYRGVAWLRRTPGGAAPDADNAQGSTDTAR
jgi:hypothetical protein